MPFSSIILYTQNTLVHRKEYYSPIKKTAVLIRASPWMNLANIKFSERR